MCFEIEDNVLNKYTGEEEKVVIPEGIEAIGGVAFSDCLSVKEVVIPDSVKSIGSYAFNNSGLHSIVIPDSVQELGRKAFEDCTNLEKVVIGNGVKRLPESCFHCCYHLDHLELPLGLETLGYRPFEDCYALRTAWVNGFEYRLRDEDAPKPVKLVFESLESIRKSILYDYNNGLMDEFEYIDYEIAGDGYTY